MQLHPYRAQQVYVYNVLHCAQMCFTLCVIKAVYKMSELFIM